MAVFDTVYVAPLPEGVLLADVRSPDLLLRVQQLAQEGDGAFLAALMRATDGWYGQGAEGSEWLNEMLWEVLEVQPDMTLRALADLPQDERARVVEREYLRPVHDGFDFATIVSGLRAADVPPGLEADVERIVAIAARLVN